MFDSRVFGEYLRRSRELKRLDQKQVAERMGDALIERAWDQSLVSKWEKGRVARPTEDHLRAWSRVLDVGMVDMLIAASMLTPDDVLAWGGQVAPGISLPPEVWKELNLTPDLQLAEARIVRELVEGLRRAEEGEGGVVIRLPVRE